MGSLTYTASLQVPVDIESLPFASEIAWIGKFLPSDKLHSRLIRVPESDWINVPGSDRLRVEIVFHSDVTDDEAARALADQVGVNKHGQDTWLAEATPAQLEDLVDMDIVLLALPALPPPEPLNDETRRISRTNEAQGINVMSGAASYTGVTGANIRIGICDFPIDTSHIDFSDPTGSNACSSGDGTRFYVKGPNGIDPCVPIAPPNRHGTHVAGIAAGNGLASAGLNPAFKHRGHAPGACLGEFIPFRADLELYHCAIVNHGTNVTNHSYSISDKPEYLATERSIDSIIRGDSEWNGQQIPFRPQVWAAGNNGRCNEDPSSTDFGYFSIQASSKNLISVGSIDTEDGQVSHFSSRGPTIDGRLKPDLVAPGARKPKPIPNNCDELYSLGTAGPHYPQTYAHYAGTSMAAPVVTGTIALMMETINIFGGAAVKLFPSTYKALLIQTANDRDNTPSSVGSSTPLATDPPVVLYDRGPDYATGYGMVDAASACDAIGSPGTWSESALRWTDEQHTYCVKVDPATPELKVTIAWDDLPGCIATSPTSIKLINDLDLVLIDPTGRTVEPWVLEPAMAAGASEFLPATRGVDQRNNVEMVSLFKPMKGIWKIEIKATQLPMGTVQSYSLAASEPLRFFCWDVNLPRVPKDLCQHFPWVCETVEFDSPLYEPGSQTWNWTGTTVLAIQELRKFAHAPAIAQGYAWEAGPEFEIAVSPLAIGDQVVVFNESGAIIASASSRTDQVLVRVAGSDSGDRLFMLLADAAGQPITRSARLSIRVR